MKQKKNGPYDHKKIEAKWPSSAKTTAGQAKGSKIYDHKKIELKWQKTWKDSGLYVTSDNSKKPKAYVLDMFPYPSGEGLHVGHPKGYVASDIYARFKRMNGFNVLHPMGWDAFGLPAENYAIKNKVNPAVSTKKNIANFRRQIDRLGFSYDWSREINTTDPEYYKWTQWIFLQLLKKGLAYQSFEAINWCPSCQTGLANEDLEGNKCERCGSVVEKRPMRQWVLKITDYADRLLLGLNDLPWPESVKESQRHWIGRSEGALIKFPLQRKHKYVFLHGWRGHSEKFFFPWLKRELEQRGHQVVALNLPDPYLPDITAQAAYALDQTVFDEDTVIVAHSLGSVVAYRILEQLTRPIHKLVIVAGLIEPRFRDKERWETRILLNWKFDSVKIKKNAGQITILEDLNDPIILAGESETIGRAIGGQTAKLAAVEPHFCGEREPAVLERCLDEVEVFTTRADTLFGVTYLVLAPDHPLIERWRANIKNFAQVKEFAARALAQTEIERSAENREPAGQLLEGLKALNPVTGEPIPIWTADYVLADYGTGAVMAVPAHDQRDYLFAKKYQLPIKQVIEEDLPTKVEHAGQAYTAEGPLLDSGLATGLSGLPAKRALVKMAGGRLSVSYRLRDWVFSRQRYWGEPIPVVHCEACALKNPAGGGVVPVPEQDLPVLLPKVKSYAPTGTGESPLADIKAWVNTKCPVCNGPAKRETNTMPQWAGSSWYYLRYADPNNKQTLADRQALDYWLPVDLYVGGVEHATRHLIYARFWHKFLFDLGLVSEDEPFRELKNPGMILGADGRKMSKRWGNVVNPDEIARDFGADTFRIYEMFMGPFEQGGLWNPDNLMGPRRFLERVWRLADRVVAKSKRDTPDILLHQTIKQVTRDFEQFGFNTAISALMILINDWEKRGSLPLKDWQTFLKLLAPLAPHLAEELWRRAGGKSSVHLAIWPDFDPKVLAERQVKLTIQINGKTRANLSMPSGLGENEVKALAVASATIQKWLAGQQIKKIIFVPDRLINLVT